MIVGAPELYLDPAIRTWVVYPVLIVMILVGLIRHYATMLAAPMPPVLGHKEDIEANYLRYATMLRTQSFNLDEQAFRMRSANLVPALRRGDYLAEPDAKPTSGMPTITDPKSMDSMVTMVRTQVLNYVPQTLMMSWVSSFFGGFVVLKLPFPLTTRFKEMLQAGIGTPDLDVRWVSSISWYIVLLFGLNSVYALILGTNNQAAQVQQNAQQSAAAAFMPSGPNVNKRQLFETEADHIDLVRHRSVLTGVVGRVLAA